MRPTRQTESEHRELLRKKQSVLDAILTVIADNPALNAATTPSLVIYPIRTTPFFAVYVYDDAEVRVLFLFIRSDDIDPSSVEW